jgi:hypothetical protein
MSYARVSQYPSLLALIRRLGGQELKRFGIVRLCCNLGFFAHFAMRNVKFAWLVRLNCELAAF